MTDEQAERLIAAVERMALANERSARALEIMEATPEPRIALDPLSPWSWLPAAIRPQ